MKRRRRIRVGIRAGRSIPQSRGSPGRPRSTWLVRRPGWYRKRRSRRAEPDGQRQADGAGGVLGDGTHWSVAKRGRPRSAGRVGQYHWVEGLRYTGLRSYSAAIDCGL